MLANAATDASLVIVASAAALVLVGLALRVIFRGGKGRFKFGSVEASVDATSILHKIQTTTEGISRSTEEINRAVNHRNADEPPLIERVVATEEMARLNQTMLVETQAMLRAHVEETMTAFRHQSGEISGLREEIATLRELATPLAAEVREHFQWSEGAAAIIEEKLGVDLD
jgi:hypothetical protein